MRGSKTTTPFTPTTRTSSSSATNVATRSTRSPKLWTADFRVVERVTTQGAPAVTRKSLVAWKRGDQGWSNTYCRPASSVITPESQCCGVRILAPSLDVSFSPMRMQSPINRCHTL